MQSFKTVTTTAIILGFTCFAGIVTAEPKAEKSVEVDSGRFEKYIQSFEKWDSKNYYPTNETLFVGSSSIRMWKTRESFSDLPLLNRGFGGAHISDVNHFAKRIVLPYKPRLIVFYAGDNDIAGNKTPQRVLEDYKTFVDLVHKELPKTNIIFLPIKPSIARWKFWPAMKEANGLIEKYSNGNPLLHYVDTAAPMLEKDGQVRRDIYLDDGLHMNDKGYEVWTKVLRPVMDKLLKD